MQRLIWVIAVLALVSAPAAFASPVLSGSYLRVGVSDSGGLIDDGFTVGIDFDTTGTGSWTGYDFLKPGTPYEFFSVGVGGSHVTDGYVYGNVLGGTTTDTSVGSMNSAHTDTSWGFLRISQDLWFDDASGWIDFQVRLTNTSTSDTLRDVVYARGLDPDQDVYAGGGYETDNEIPSGDLVFGSAPITDWTIAIFSNSAYRHVPTVDFSGLGVNFWDDDPYRLLVAHFDGDLDASINMAWDIGTLTPGQSALITFQYRIGEQRGDVLVPEPSTLVLVGFGALGLVLRRRRKS